MKEFIRTLLRILDATTKRRLALASLGATLLAGLEAIGLALIAPLVLTVNATAGDRRTVPSSARWIADLFGTSEPGRLAALLGLAVVCAFVLKGVLAVLLLRWTVGVVLHAEAETSARLFRGYLLAPWTFHLQRNSAELQRTAHDSVRRVFEDSTSALMGALADAFVIIAVAVLLIVTDLTVAVAVIAYFALVGFGYQRLIHGRAESAGSQLHHDVRRAYQTVQQGVRSAKQLILLHRQERFVQELRTIQLGMAEKKRTLILVAQLPRYYLEITLIVGVALMSALLFGTRSADTALAALGFFLAAGFRLLPSLNRILVAAGSARSDLPAVRAIHDDLALLGSSDPPAPPAPVMPPGPIVLRQVSFRYPGAYERALDAVSLRIAPGESVGIVGGSGAGKTTLLDVLLGLLPPDEGSIMVGDVGIDEASESFQRSVGYVPQDVELVDDTLLANIAFGCAGDEVDQAGVEEAVRLAQLDDVVAGLPLGLATMVGEDGVRLSGGERQRVGIARALLHRPHVLVLDEATSALDSATESRISSTIENLRGDLTIIIVAHRLSTVRKCDRLFLLGRGRIEATGTFEHLAATSPEFRDFVRLAELRHPDDTSAGAPTPDGQPTMNAVGLINVSEANN